MDKNFTGVSHFLSRFRGWIQAGATLLTNFHLPNFFKGSLYQGAGKNVCVPGLNCYSCPAASGACPIGAFQAVVGSSRFSFSYYITGFLILLAYFLDASFAVFYALSDGFRNFYIRYHRKSFLQRNLSSYGISNTPFC